MMEERPDGTGFRSTSRKEPTHEQGDRSPTNDVGQQGREHPPLIPEYFRTGAGKQDRCRFLVEHEPIAAPSPATRSRSASTFSLIAKSGYRPPVSEGASLAPRPSACKRSSCGQHVLARINHVPARQLGPTDVAREPHRQPPRGWDVATAPARPDCARHRSA
jgi:hypothetical protein